MYISTPSPDTVAEAIAQMDLGPGDGIAALLCDEDHQRLDGVIEGLGDVPTIGGVFPAIIADGERKTTGLVLRPLPLGGLGTRMVPLVEGDQPLPEGTVGAMVFVDGLGDGVAGYLRRLFAANGADVTVVGGGAGSLTFERRPAVFTEAGSAIDAAVVACLPETLSLGVGHGWQRFSGPLVATRTDGNTIHELNWRPAAEVYREIVEPDAGVEITIDGFFDVAKGYPFGIVRDGLEDVVRDPIEMGADGSLFCVGDVPANSVLHLLKGTEDSLLAAAEDAAKQSVAPVAAGPVDAFVVDCISRTLYLEDGFDAELTRIEGVLGADRRAVDGVLSLGEISSYGTGFIEFFNKTTVVASAPSRTS